MRKGEKILKLTKLCEGFLDRYPYDGVPKFEYEEEDVKSATPQQVVYSIYKRLKDHSFPHETRFEQAQEIINNPHAQKILSKSSFGERFLHIAKCILTLNFRDIARTPCELFARRIKGLFNDDKPKPRLEFEEPQKPQIKSLLPKGGLFEQRRAFDRMNSEQFGDRYFRFEGKKC